MKRTDKLLICLLILSCCVTAAGYFLYTILIPVQDLDTLNKAELLAAQKELALNYPLGNVLFRCGLFIFVLSFIIFVIRMIHHKRNCK